MRGRFFYGWVIAAAAALGTACCTSAMISALLGIFAGPLSAEFGWRTQDVFLGQLVATVVTIPMAPLIGALVDRLGARRVILFSFLMEALILASFSRLNGSLWLFLLRYVLLVVLAIGNTNVAFAQLVARWFNRRRGLALGIALAGVGLGGAIWSVSSQYLIDHYGWRTAYLCIAAVLLLVTLPLMALTLRNSPAEIGAFPDGADSAPPESVPQPGPGQFTLREAMGTLQFWRMALTFFLIGLVVYGVQGNLVPMLRGNGMSGQAAANVQASLWMLLVLGRASTGWFLDRFFAPRVSIVLLIPAIGGVLLLASGVTDGMAFVAAMLVGFAAGAEVDVVPYMTGRYFGLLQYARIYGTFFSAFGLGSGLGPWLTASFAQRMGGYAWPLGADALVLGLVIILFLSFARYPARVART